ncbi:MAG: two-component system, cell cycle response regulator DivK [Acidobacteriota bacterium]|jgi:CheY-like chemotaxis protein|nr:two-component system, cell cycle response regulator DivK [Acidobacteriota bacterium]
MQATKHPSVLVADDSKDTREILRRWLEMKRYRVVEAMNGQEVLDLTRGECPDLILMSMRMSVLDGLAAARCIRRDAGECDVPIVAMSTYPTKEEQAIALAAGCNWFIAQPIDFDHLSELLKSLLPASASH